jgi:hypothetical protein
MSSSRKPRAPSLYLIEWLDPRAHNDGDPAEIVNDAARVHTVGWITAETPTRYVISQEIVHDEHASTSTAWRSSTVVMKSLVVRKTRLESR